MTVLKKGRHDKEEAIRTANTKIIYLEKNNNSIESKLNFYRGTLRKSIKEKEEKGMVEDKEKQK